MSANRRLAAAAVAVAAPAAVSLLALGSFKPIIPALLFVLAIAAASALGGILYGLVASALSFASLLVFWQEERDEIYTSSEQLVTGIVFLVTAIGAGALIERERRARETAVHTHAAAEAAAAASTRLQRAAEALSSAVTPEQVLDAVLTQGVAAAEARAGLIAVVTEDGKELEILAQRGFPADRLRGWGRFSLDSDYPMSYAVRNREPVFIGSEAERLERFPALPPMRDQTHALVCLPLVVEGRTIGGLTFSFGEDQQFDDERRSLKVALARQAAQALDRARVYEALEASEGRMSLLAEASSILSASLDYETTLSRLASVAVPGLADWCTVDVLEEDGEITRIAVAHEDSSKVEWGLELQWRFPHRRDAESGIPYVLHTGEPEFLPEIPQELLDRAVEQEPALAEVIEELEPSSWICVPLKGHDRVLGALSLVGTKPRTFTQADFELAKAVADRAGVAVSNALLFREAERRGDAARALTYVGDAVVLVDADSTVRFWNTAAELILGREAADAVGRPAAEVVPGWDLVESQVEPAGTGKLARSATIPIAAHDQERWLSVTSVDFGEGRVYALRDTTEAHALEQARSEFVATASHELRTPLAAVYGAVRTLRRTDVDISPADRELFLGMIESETERLNAIVSQILVAGQLESESLPLTEATCNLPALAESVLAAARVRAPGSVSLELNAPEAMPPVRCDEDRLRQVLVNLVENAIKYSPDGGHVKLELSATNGRARIDVSDQGLGIPAQDQARIFEKFARLDPTLTRGVGGTGLGLYIARELIERMGGDIRLESRVGHGSTFTVELPVQEPVVT